jgi:hypothetical protein
MTQQTTEQTMHAGDLVLVSATNASGYSESYEGVLINRFITWGGSSKGVNVKITSTSVEKMQSVVGYELAFNDDEWTIEVVASKYAKCMTCGLDYTGNIVDHAQTRVHAAIVKRIRGW